MSERYNQATNSSLDFHKDDMKKYKNILSKKKNQQGGIDSFWIFKKDPVKEEKKKPKGQAGVEGGEENGEENLEINKT